MTTRRGGRGRPAPTHRYPRTARLNRLVREIVAEALDAVDDERLEFVTVTTVEVEPDLRHALVYFDSLAGEAGDPEVLEALGEARIRLQAAIGREARIKRTPELAFRPDEAVREGNRIESILRDIGPLPDDEDDDEASDTPGDEPGDGAGGPADGPDEG